MARIKIGNIKGPVGPTGKTGPVGPVGPIGPVGPLPPLANNFTTTQAGVAALDAAAGKQLKDGLNQVNSDMNIASTNRSTTSNIGTAIQYLTGFDAGQETESMKPVESGIYIKKTGMYILSIRFALTGCGDNQISYGFRNYVSADNYSDVLDVDFCTHTQGFGRTQTRILKLTAGSYVRPVLGGSVASGRCTAVAIAMMAVKSM